MRDLEQHKKQEDSPPREMTVEEFYRRKCLKAETEVERLLMAKFRAFEDAMARLRDDLAELDEEEG